MHTLGILSFIFNLTKTIPSVQLAAVATETLSLVFKLHSGKA